MSNCIKLYILECAFYRRAAPNWKYKKKGILWWALIWLQRTFWNIWSTWSGLVGLRRVLVFSISPRGPLNYMIKPTSKISKEPNKKQIIIFRVVIAAKTIDNGEMNLMQIIMINQEEWRNKNGLATKSLRYRGVIFFLSMPRSKMSWTLFCLWRMPGIYFKWYLPWYDDLFYPCTFYRWMLIIFYHEWRCILWNGYRVRRIKTICH